jgi:hypothetical protein
MESRHNYLAARRLLERAIALDPQCAVAYLQLAALPRDAHEPASACRYSLHLLYLYKSTDTDAAVACARSNSARQLQLCRRALDAFEVSSRIDTYYGPSELHATALCAYAGALIADLRERKLAAHAAAALSRMPTSAASVSTAAGLPAITPRSSVYVLY